MIPRSNAVSEHRSGNVATIVREIAVSKAVVWKGDCLSVGIPLRSAEQDPPQNGPSRRSQPHLR